MPKLPEGCCLTARRSSAGAPASGARAESPGHAPAPSPEPDIRPVDPLTRLLCAPPTGTSIGELADAAAVLLARVPDRVAAYWRDSAADCRPGSASSSGVPVVDEVRSALYTAADGSRRMQRRAVARPQLRRDELLGRAARTLPHETISGHRHCHHQGHAIALVLHEDASAEDVDHALTLLRTARDWHPGLLRALLITPALAGDAGTCTGRDTSGDRAEALMDLLAQRRTSDSPAARLTRILGPLWDHLMPAALAGGHPTVIQRFAAATLDDDARRALATSPLMVEALRTATRRLRVDAARHSEIAAVQWALYEAGLRRDVLANRRLHDWVHLRALGHRSEELWRPAAERAREFSDEVLAGALGLDRAVLVAMAANPGLTAEQLDRLLAHPFPEVRAAALANPAVSVADLTERAAAGQGEDVAAHILGLL